MTKLVSYKFVDSEGNLRDKVIAASPKSLNGKWESTWFDGSSFGFRKTSNSDLLLVPDPTTVHIDPIRGMNSVFCFLQTPDGQPLDGDFRTKAYNAMCADEQTRGALFGVEPEFFLLCDTGNESSVRRFRHVPYGESDNWSANDVDRQYKWYGSLPPVDATQHIRDEMVNNLSAAGIEVESCHHEVAPGQAEISWRCDNLLRTCDKMLLVKYIIQATAALFKDSQGRQVSATFDPKPFDGINGSGCHVHQSIPAMREKAALEAYCQGLVNNYDALTAVCNVHENSPKRLVPGFEAPTKENNGYGFCDRTKTIRLPAAGGRLEFRLPDPAMNPYVALPLMLKYGREEVRRQCMV